MSGRSLLALAGWLAVCFAAAGLGSLVTAPAVSGWYASLVKPPWNPPAWIFGPVWTALYILMAIAVWRVSFAAGLRSRPVALFLIQLALNTAWSFVFFGLRNPVWALVEILALWLALAATVVAFWAVDRAASALLWPYLAWVTFAALLNATLARLNPM